MPRRRKRTFPTVEKSHVRAQSPNLLTIQIRREASVTDQGEV